MHGSLPQEGPGGGGGGMKELDVSIMCFVRATLCTNVSVPNHSEELPDEAGEAGRAKSF